MQIETHASNPPSVQPSASNDDGGGGDNGGGSNDPTSYILLGVLVPLSSFVLIYICYACLKRRNKKAEAPYEQLKQSPLIASQDNGLKQNEQHPQLQQPTTTARYQGRISHGVPQADLKFIVPAYNALQTEAERERPRSPMPMAKHFRHQSAPVGPLHWDSTKVKAALYDLHSRDSTLERPASDGASQLHGICVQMYTSESDGDSTSANTDSDERTASQGKLCFNVEVDWLQNTIKIHLKQALRLRSKSMKGSINPSIRISIQPDPKKAKFHTRPHNSANPRLDDTFSFQLPPPAHCHEETGESESTELLSHDVTHLKDLEVRMELFHCDIFSRKSEAGSITFQPFEAGPSIVSTSHPIFQTGGIEVWRDFKSAEERRDAQRHSQGQVLISLSRDPAKETLSIGILKAKDIITQVGSDSSSLLYGKMSLIQGGKVLKTKKTKTLKKMQNPIFNETFRFHIETSWLNKISVTISICVKNVLGSSKPLGRVTVGPVMYACGSGLEHWNDMMSAPKSGVAQWHHIY